MSHISVKDFAEKMSVVGMYIVADVSTAVTTKGDPYMRIVLQDSTGKFNCNAWFVDNSIVSGKVVTIDMKVQAYNGKLNGIINSISVVADQLSQEQLSELIPYTPYNIDEMWAKLNAMILSIKDKELYSLVSDMINDASDMYRSIPAARGVHHDTIGGLLQHTLEMALTADSIANLYPVVNRDLLVAGTILHDYAKTREFCINNLGLCDNYSLEGNLLGHLHMGACMVEEKGRALKISEEKILLLKHMLLSHHGNREWGAVSLPSIPEASMLFLIDMISSRMEIFRKEYGKLGIGERSLESCRVLDGAFVYRHSLSPDIENTDLKL